MSEELFIRGIMSLVISVTMFFTIEYRYEEEMDRKNSEGKRQKYLPYISTGFLVGAILGRLIYELRTYGAGAAKHVTISICFEIFLHISLYYSVLMLFISFFRKRISSRVCAALWMLPNYLYMMLYGTMQLQKPFWIVRIPKNFAEVIFYVWLMGFSYVLLRGITVHLRFRSAILKNAKGVEDEEILGLWNAELKHANMRYTKYPLMISSNVKTPLSVGIFRSAICVVLPDRAYSLEELKLIFRHEIVHIGRDDSGSKFAILLCTAMCWFNPLMWIAMRKSADDLELSCDETVLLEADAQTRYQYAKLILDTAGDERGFTTCLSASAEALKYRLQNIVKPNIRNSGAFALGLVLFVLCMSCGHIALAYGGSTGEEIVYQWEDTKTYEIDSMYLLDADETERTIVECPDTEAFHKYIANLRLQNMTGNYSFTNSERKLKFLYEAPKGTMFVELADHVIRILPFYEDVRMWRNYYLPEGVDWNYLDEILVKVPVTN